MATFGQRLTGGMANRVVVTTAAIPRAEAIIVPVTPLEPRWWDEGPLRVRGQLPPALLALLQLARSERTGLRSVAGTALWEGCRASSDDDPAVTQHGWVLLDGPVLLAARLMVPVAVTSLRARGQSPDPPGLALVRRALSDAEQDDRVAWSARPLGRLIDLTMVRASLTLPNAMLRATVPD
jgi:hypothetical protein